MANILPYFKKKGGRERESEREREIEREQCLELLYGSVPPYAWTKDGCNILIS
jgi:hypothetical protein